MFNTLDEHLFVCQSLLKERRQPTGALKEAFKESLGRGVSTPSRPVVESKMTPGASEIRFRPRKTIGYRFVRSCPHRAFPVAALRVFRGALFEAEVFTLLHKLRLEQGGVPTGRVPEFLASHFP